MRQWKWLHQHRYNETGMQDTIETSILEAAITRGDLKMAEVVEAAWKNGARFDSWNERFDFKYWQEAFMDTGVDLHQYLNELNPDSIQPWDFIDTGVCKAFLRNEWDKAINEIQTANCRELCTLCGVCNQETKTQTARQLPDPQSSPAFQHPSTPVPQHSSAPALQHRYRVYYQKLGLLRFISHLDWMRMLFRRIAVLELQTVFTQGFSPHPKVSLSPPLPVGVEGLNEFFDISFYQPYLPQQILQEFSKTKIPDFNLLKCEVLNGKANIPVNELVIVVFKWEDCKEVAEKIAEFKTQDSFIWTKNTATRHKSYDLKNIIQYLELHENELHIQKLLESPALYDVLAALLCWEKKSLYGLSVQRHNFV